MPTMGIPFAPLPESDSIYKRLMDSLYDGVYFVDRERRITYWNKAAERLTGYSAEEVLGKRCADNLLQHVDGSGHQLCLQECPLSHTIADRACHEAVVYLRHKQGHRIPVEVRAGPLVDAQGRVIGALEVFSDNTAKRDAQEKAERLRKTLQELDKSYTRLSRELAERERAEHALVQSEKLATVGRMAATIAHEINNPLEAIGNAVYLACSDNTISETTRSYLEIAVQELERVAQYTRHALGFCRDTRIPKSIDLQESADGVLNLFGPKLRTRGITLARRYQVVESITAVDGEIRQIISNLLSNSIDAVPAQGRIECRISSVAGKGDTRYVRFTIGDTGSGIPREHLERIFQPFFTTKESVGTGLGLWITKQLVEKHGGTIRIRSTPRAGTVVSVTFPVAATA